MNATATCLIVFLLVAGSYLFVQMFLEKPDFSSLPARRHLPPLFRNCYWLIAVFSASLGASAQRLLSRKSLDRLEQQLKVAAIEVPPAFIITAQWLFALLGALIGFFSGLLLFYSQAGAAIAAILLALLGMILPSMTVSSRVEARQKAITRALPFAIDLVASAMRSGLDFSAAVRYYVASEDKTSVLAQEFALMLRDIQLGKTRVEALERMAARVQTDDFTAFTNAIIHGTEIGAAISETIKIQGEDMRRKRFARAEELAAQAPGKMLFPIAIFIMPAFFIMLGVPLYLKVKSSGM